MSTSTTSDVAVIPAPRTPAANETSSRRQRPADQYWNVFEACWCVAKACVKPAAGG
jgi:hypothetical protein